MIKDHTTLLKVVLFTFRKTTYSLNMFEHNILVFIFRSKTMIVKDEDDYDGVFSLDSLFESNECFNKMYLSLVPVKKGTLFGALYDGIRIVNWYISRTAGSKLKSKYQPIRSMTFYSISKKSEDTKAFNWKFFSTSP